MGQEEQREPAPPQIEYLNLTFESALEHREGKRVEVQFSLTDLKALLHREILLQADGLQPGEPHLDGNLEEVVETLGLRLRLLPI